MILVVILYAAFGLSFTIGKLLVEYSQPLFVVGLRMTIGGLVLLAYMRYYKGETFYIYRHNIVRYLQAIIFNIFLPYNLRLWGLQYVTTAKSSLLYNLSPFFTAIFAYLILHERLTILKTIGLIIGFLGTIPLLIGNTGAADVGSYLSFLPTAELAVVGSVASLSYSLIIVQRLAKDEKSPSYFIMGLSMFFGGLLSLLSSLLLETNLIWQVNEPLIKKSGPYLIGILCFQVLLSNVICQNLRVELLKYYSSTFMAFAGFLGPLFTSVYGRIFFNETMTWHFFVSFVIVMTGLALYHYDDKRPLTTSRYFRKDKQ